ncbi:MAG: thiamine pyrophosphate-binding protein [Deltaproteobacteria bacterium]|nr:thiamine pyrophosphate-binding protein [Deltaproteobacteria bacterium]
MHGGDVIARHLYENGVRCLFTLCGGHISPILSGAKALGIRIIDVRHEANAAFAADAIGRLSGMPGVCAVTAGPGVTNTLTAVKNAQCAQSPMVVFGGATATALRGRGALQDIDQIELIAPHVKKAFPITTVRDLGPAVDEAFRVARSGTPGPVFVEAPVDLLYPEHVVREWYGAKSGGDESDTAKKKKRFSERALSFVLSRHVEDLFSGSTKLLRGQRRSALVPEPSKRHIKQAAEALLKAERPLLLIGSQALTDAAQVGSLADAVERLQIPVFLSGMARGLLGRDHPLQLRHKRRLALKDADCVVLAGVTCDFRLDYGAHIRRRACLISANLRSADLFKNRIPDIADRSNPGAFLQALAAYMSLGRSPETTPQKDAAGDVEEPSVPAAWTVFLGKLRQRNVARDEEIEREADAPSKGQGINPLALCREIERAVDDKGVFVADGGDFVGTAAYIVRPRGPMRWLDPGVFGTLGVGAGFAMGAKAMRPDDEVWILYGDGSVGFSLAEFDTFARHKLGVIAVVGNDGCWSQIARDQIKTLGDDVGVMLEQTPYHLAVEGLGGKGFLLEDIADAPRVFAAAEAVAKTGRPVLINALIAKSDFREGSLSV